MKTLAALSILTLALFLGACQSTPKPVLTTPEETVGAMRRAYNEDDSSLFLHCLGAPVLREISEHTIRVAWGEIRPKVGGLVEKARAIEVSNYQVPTGAPMPAKGFVRPAMDAPAKVLVLEVDGKRERFLFQREIDPAPETAKQAKGFWIGDRYFMRSEHPSAETYLVEDSPEKDRTHWRLVFPYEPFQRNGELTIMLQQTLAAEKK